MRYSTMSGSHSVAVAADSACHRKARRHGSQPMEDRTLPALLHLIREQPTSLRCDAASRCCLQGQATAGDECGSSRFGSPHRQWELRSAHNASADINTLCASPHPLHRSPPPPQPPSTHHSPRPLLPQQWLSRDDACPSSTRVVSESRVVLPSDAFVSSRRAERFVATAAPAHVVLISAHS